MQIFEAIRQDHERQRLLLKILVETSGATEARREYFEDLKKELTQHAKAEERYFYSPLMESDKTIDASRHGIAEHHEIDELIEKLDQTSMSSAAWLRYMKELQEKVEHHLTEEEREFFQRAGKVLSEKEKEALAEEYQLEMEPIRG
ncbi:hemerythrin domain-containing protein [Alteromonas oceanisediminis]|uniref:hemerythrin domain-containing protein n=1 Tax=Alteromonas oceanisediminis TaxID=2836180 RepID=UPI001BD92C87|nr:hemerythrin domain-containing protein [Alteromonas oceanisediminis]MBT0586682.1 hemerythrin domain-containing protein [Alteromonas oceanisediminis]